MPLAVALLCHPAGAYGCVVAALAALVYAWHTRSFVPAFAAAAAALLATLAFLQLPRDPAGVLLLAVGVALLQGEFVLSTYGVALLAGFAAGVSGSWLLLAAAPHAALAAPLRAAIAVAGTLTLLAAVLRGFRLRTLGR